MNDREKVIAALTLCANGEPCCRQKFVDCPYSPIGKPDWYNCAAVMAADALALLNELESERKAAMDAVKVLEDAARTREEGVKPIMQDAWPVPIYLCGKCGTGLWKRDDFKSQYCINCGRKVKWDDAK